MAKIIQFTPRKELTAQENLHNLIKLSKKHLELWADQPDFFWENNRWPLPYHSVRFTNHEHRKLHPSKKPKPHQLMHPAFVEFAKAYLRYRHTIKPHKNPGREMTAFRLLEMVLKNDMSVPDITKINQRHFDHVVAIIRTEKTRQHIADEMLYILRTLSDFFIVTEAVRYWTHPYVRTASYTYANGTYANAEKKAAKLPDQDALLAIASVFSRGHSQRLEDADILVTSITCILLSVPMRISETLKLRVDCLRQGADKDDNVQHHLNYWTPKIKEFIPKAIPTTMAPNAVIAIERLKSISEEGRRLASYMEGNPNKFYRHKNCPDVADDQELTRHQVSAALGFPNLNSCYDFIHRHTGKYSLKGFTLDSLWQLVLAEHRKLNPHFPYQEPINENHKPLKMSESLMCFLRFQFGLRSSVCPVLLVPFNQHYYTMRLKGSALHHQKIMCFFSRHGFESIKLKSHSLRHLLNRLARQSEVSIDTITAWSSRASSHQTLTYLNDSPEEAANKSSVLLGMQQKQNHKQPITDEVAEIHSQGPFHRSRYGLCRRSWRAGPCNRFADCLNCSELLICKGDKLVAEAVTRDREHLIRTYNAAKEAVDSGERAASRWLQVAGPQIGRLSQLVNMLNDSSIPNGSPIELADSTNFSHEQTLLETKSSVAEVRLLDRNELGIEYGDDLLACFDLLWNPDDV
ncbi:integrase [Pseudomonas neustonica]|uniref:Integrase n=2 Tax=Pseudomonas TaxID=286 RepID=A0ABX9XCS1_9PSED|nr:integrase [Pseudomonas sp. SSM44]ROZ80547.1 integrase [Pseudomonas neustonica]